MPRMVQRDNPPHLFSLLPGEYFVHPGHCFTCSQIPHKIAVIICHCKPVLTYTDTTNMSYLNKLVFNVVFIANNGPLYGTLKVCHAIGRLVQSQFYK